MSKITSIELFAGAGGLALGMEKAGFEHLLLCEWDKWACKTLRTNRPKWNVLEGDVSGVDFSEYKDNVDLVSGGFPCQAFSYAGKQLGFEDTRGTMFFEFARCIKETNTKFFLGENVKGLKSHDGGKTLKTILEVLDQMGYHCFTPTVLNSNEYNVPQKRERLILFGVRKDLYNNKDFIFPEKQDFKPTLKDALKKGKLFDCDVPTSNGFEYPQKKIEVLNQVPQGGYWRDLPVEVQKDYMGGSFHLGGGKTGIARRIGWNEPCLTLTCSPAQKQTERCHPEETRPFQTREYARIQTFPDNWKFEGSTSQIYKQIGNAVPVNLAFAIGKSIKKYISSL